MLRCWEEAGGWYKEGLTSHTIARYYHSTVTCEAIPGREKGVLVYVEGVQSLVTDSKGV